MQGATQAGVRKMVKTTRDNFRSEYNSLPEDRPFHWGATFAALTARDTFDAHTDMTASLLGKSRETWDYSTNRVVDEVCENVGTECGVVVSVVPESEAEKQVEAVLERLEFQTMSIEYGHLTVHVGVPTRDTVDRLA